MQAIELDLKPISSATDVPMAVHGTTRKAWGSISVQGLSRRGRNHIHLAQGVPGDGVMSGMRNSSEVLIYIDVQKALDAGFKFFLSENGVVLTEGDHHGFLSPEYFLRVEDRRSGAIQGWPLSSTRKQ
jgi:2'-phosphotransferase